MTSRPSRPASWHSAQTLQQDSIGPEGYGWRVYTDPVGHPFCLCRNKGAVWTDQGLTWSESDE